MTARRRPSRSRKLLAQLALGALALLLLEGALRLLGLGPAPGADPYVGFASNVPLFVADEAAGAWVTAPGKTKWFNTQSFALHKPPGTRRVFVLGGSTAYGHPYDDRVSFAGMLREMLPAAAPGARWEIVNAGGISYASYREVVLMEELLRHEPDVFIVYGSHNEFLEERTYAGLRRLPGWLLRLGAAARRTALGTLAGRLVGQGERALLPAEVDTVLERVAGLELYHRDDAQRAAVLQHYRENLGRMGELAASAGARLILVTPASELADCAPFKSQHGEDVDGSALEDLEQVTRQDPRWAEGWYRLGLSLRSAGDPVGAKAALVRARDEDVCPLRAPTDFIQAVRDAGGELLDFVALVDAHAPQGIPGRESFLDHVHPTIAGYARLAEALVPLLAGDELVPGWGREQAARVAVEVEARLSVDDHVIALRNLAKVLGWAGKHDEAAALAREVLQRSGGGDAESHFLLGTFALHGGRWDEAAQHFRDALAVDPAYADAAYDLGEALRQAGRKDEAVQAFLQAARLQPEKVSALNNAGLLLVELDRPAEALAHLDAALAREPDYASAHNNRGLALSGLLRLDEAAGALRRAIELDPSSARPHYNLALLLLAQGERGLARAELSLTLALDPGHAAARARLDELAP